MAKIELVNLTKKFGSVIAVNNISATVNDGELVALLGPSGCGKTTTLRCIAGFEVPDMGKILADGKLINDLAPEKRDIGMVFQNYALFPHMTVFDNIAFGLRMRKLSKKEIEKKVMDVLDVVSLSGYENRYPRQLSGGQQQRVAIARALVINPNLLLLDEPLANLDAKLREEMRFYLRSLQQKFKITTIYVTHDQAEALVLANKIVVLFEGSIHQVGSPTEIYKFPKTKKVAAFIGLINFIEGKIIEIENGLILVDTKMGKVLCKNYGVAKYKVSDEVVIAVRPESIELGKEEENYNKNYFQGEIVKRAYLGNTIDYRVNLGSENIFRVQANPNVDLEIGTEVNISFSSENAWIVPESNY